MTKPEVAVVGAGPAGMAAALALDSAGAAVTLVDEQPAAGGQIYRAVDHVAERHPQNLAVLGEDYAAGGKMTAGLRESGVRMVRDASVWDIAGGESPRLGLVDRDGASMMNPDHIVLATGAMERPMPFPGWTLPGVMGVGAAQTLLKASGLIPDCRVVVAGSGPLVYLFIRQMLAAGGRPAALLDTAPARPPAHLWAQLVHAAFADPSALRKGRAWLGEIREVGIPHQHRIRQFRALGGERIEAVEYEDAGQRKQRIACDLLLVHDGVIPNTHLAMAADCTHAWNPIQQYWRPAVDPLGFSSVNRISICGDQAGILGADAAERGGRVTGLGVANRLNLIDGDELKRVTAEDQARLRKLSVLRRFLDAFYLPLAFCQVPPDDDTIVCRCEQVSAGELRTVASHGCMGPNQGKAFTRCGMGPCMGRYCGNTVSQILASHHGKPVESIGHYRIRPPVRPISVGDLASMG